MFNIGDQVVCVDNKDVDSMLTKDKVYTVVSVMPLCNLVGVRNDRGNESDFKFDRFELYSPPLPITSPILRQKPPFKVGDKVICVDNSWLLQDILEVGKEYEIDKIDILADQQWLKIVGIKWCTFGAYRFELATQPISKPTLEYVSKTGVILIKDNDMVVHPMHYTAGGIETLDYIKAKLGVLTQLTPFQAYCWGNVIKYLSRLGLKGDMNEDIGKALTYLNAMKGNDRD